MPDENVEVVEENEDFSYPQDLIYSEVYKQIRSYINKKKLLDLGCGDGSFLNRYAILEDPSEIHGYDPSETNIENAQNNEMGKLRKIIFRGISFESLKFEIDENLIMDKDFDVLTSIGVIEYLDNPENLFYIASKLLKSGGYFVLEHPNFLNLRGIIWKTLELFVGAKIPKTILPDKVFEYMNRYDFECETILTFDNNRGMYSEMIWDFVKKLKPSLEGKVEDLDNKIVAFFEYLNFVTNERIFSYGSANGAEILYRFKKK